MTPSLDAKFAALAHPTRRAILGKLTRGQATLTELAEPFDMTVPAVLKHVGVLERAGLVRRLARTSVRPVELAPGGLSEVVDWVERNREFWDASFDRLEGALARRKAKARR